MQIEQLRNRWREREATTPIDATMKFCAQGLVLGAGTVLAAANEDGGLQDACVEDAQARLLALLAAAYGRLPDARAVGHIRKAADCWAAGDAARADLHLALTGLGRLEPANQSAHRLVLADALMANGGGADTVLKALNLDPSCLDWTRRYNDQELRIPMGHTGGGRWTDGSGPTPARRAKPKPAAQVGRGPGVAAPARPEAGPKPVRTALEELTPEAEESLGAFAARLLAGAAVEGTLALGLALIPTTGRDEAKGQVPGRPTLRYAWNRDEGFLRITGPGPDGVRRTVRAQVGLDGVFRDPAGRAVARVLANGVLAIDTAIASKEFANQPKDDGSKLCPKPEPDRPGNNNPKDRVYEDFVKDYVNGEEAAPSGWGVALPNLRIRPRADPLVMFDDCEHDDGAMIEAKGHYAWMFEIEKAKKKIGDDWLEQAERQIIAANAQNRPVIWYFKDLAAAKFARELFDNAKDSRLHQIQTRFLPMGRSHVR